MGTATNRRTSCLRVSKPLVYTDRTRVKATVTFSTLAKKVCYIRQARFLPIILSIPPSGGRFVSSGTSRLVVLPDDRKRYGVFEELNEVQSRFGYLPEDQLKQVAARRGLALRDVHSVATFYPHFHLHQPKKVDVRFCDDMTCHLMGACELRNRVEEKFPADSRSDITFNAVSCLGRCDQAPAIAVNDRIYDDLDIARTVGIVQEALGGIYISGREPRSYRDKLRCDPYDGHGHYSALRALIQSQDFEGAIAKLKDAGLKGMGGAGFPTATKWEFVRNQKSDEKFVVCNADESEPGTIKDRFIMQEMPHMVIEGMIIAALTVGAKRGWIYIRHEYEHSAQRIQEEILKCYAEGLLGPNILDTDLSFDLEVFISPGGYICGEVSAMLEAIEGKRAEPRDKPPQTGSHGLWQKPTLANNVETFSAAAAILVRGAEWWNSFGKNGGKGLKIVAITGHVALPGAYEIEMGTTYKELLDMAGGVLQGASLLGFAPSGPSSGYLPASMIDLPIEWGAVSKAGSMVGSAAVVICAEGSCMLDMALNAIRFFRNESCGKCVPCRVGTQKMVDMLTAWSKGKFSDDQMPLLNELSETMKSASICGLGQIAPVPILSVIKHFPDHMEAHLVHKKCPGDVCFSR